MTTERDRELRAIDERLRRIIRTELRQFFKFVEPGKEAQIELLNEQPCQCDYCKANRRGH